MIWSTGWRILLLAALLTGALRWLAYQPPHFHEIRQALSQSTGCETSPCYLGIYPGRSDIQQAVRALRAHPWVDQILTLRGASNITDTSGADRPNSHVVSWRWSTASPAFFLSPASFEAHQPMDRVNWITFQTGISYAELWLAFGHPVSIRTYGQVQFAYYETFAVRLRTRCDTFWDTPAEIYISRWQESGVSGTASDMWRAACGHSTLPAEAAP